MKKYLKWSLIGLGLTGLLAASIPLAVSCSNQPSSKVDVKERRFDAKQSSSQRSGEEITPKETYEYDAKHNTNAQKILTELTSKLNVAELQTDFNRVLTDFYEAYEAKAGNFAEIEIEKIKVNSKNPDGSFELKVTYELEIENKKDKEMIQDKTFNWTPKFTLLNNQDIENIKQMISSVSGEQNGIDLSDIKEIFLGDDDRDELDDWGIFDRLKLINKNNNNLAHMVAYELSIADIFDHIKPGAKTTIDKNTKFRIPSIALNGGSLVLIPNSKPRINNNFNTFNTSQLDTMFSSDNKITVLSEIQEELKKLFVGEISPKLEVVEIKYWAKTTSPIDNSNVYKLTIMYRHNGDLEDGVWYSQDVFYLYPSTTTN